MGIPDTVFHTHVSLCISIYIYLYVFQYISVKEFLKNQPQTIIIHAIKFIIIQPRLKYWLVDIHLSLKTLVIQTSFHHPTNSGLTFKELNCLFWLVCWLHYHDNNQFLYPLYFCKQVCDGIFWGVLRGGFFIDCSVR